MMKYLIVFAFAFYAASATPPHLLGAKQCTWGPSYWCANLTAASGCHAVPHCIQTVWQHQTVPEDKDSVCQICLDMVKQARDQLLSNETEEEIKQVFEGSCKLIPVKVINRECCALVDDFIPELIDTLASQMNPQVVCSVAGLCNNGRYDRLIADYETNKRSTKKIDQCEGCHTVVDILQHRFEKMSKDEVLQGFLRICGRMGSLSDACSNIVVTYFPDIYQHLEVNLNANDVCLLAGECSAQFHRHVEITTISNVGVVKVGEKDDLPCELCQQLVAHLRDLLVANTTEEEFERVLQGLCKQTGQFANECQSLVSEYYPMIYKTLVEQLNGTVACAMIGICPAPNEDYEDMPIRPLLPVQSANKAVALADEHPPKKIGKVHLAKPEMMQLPIERVFPAFGAPEVYDQQTCIFCEYLLHYLQEVITEPATASEIKRVMSKVCQKLPASVNATCWAFVATYGDAICSLLAQEFDPSIICPLLRVCPPPAQMKDVEMFKEVVGGDQPKCPMCLFAVTKLEQMIKDDRTEENIRKSLNKLCSHLNDKLKEECEDFVDTYSKTLVTLLIDDLKPQNVCVALKLCSDKAPDKPITPVKIDDVDVLTNEIPDHTRNGVSMSQPVKVEEKPQCVLCEFIMSKLEDILQNKTTEEEIKNGVLKICDELPKSVRPECKKLVNTYSDLVIALLLESLKPDEICGYLGLCGVNGQQAPVISESPQAETLPKSPQCVICKMVMGQIEKALIGPITREGVERALHQVCNLVPNNEKRSCNQFVVKYGDTIATLLIQAAQPGEICSLMFLCAENNDRILSEIRLCATCEALYINVVNGMLNDMENVEDACIPVEEQYKPKCLEIAKMHSVTLVRSAFHQFDVTTVCRELEYCKGPKSLGRVQRQALIGSDKCSWGPSYWCASEKNARQCHAMEACGFSTGRSRRSLPNKRPFWGQSYWRDY